MKISHTSLIAVVVCTATLAVSLSSLKMASGSVPKNVTNDTLIYENLSEIRAARQKDLSFDSDFSKLKRLEASYHERLPSLSRHQRLKAPVDRISKMKYRRG